MDIQTSPDPVARARELGAEIAAAADEIERTRRRSVNAPAGTAIRKRHILPRYIKPRFE